ncbi:MAG: serine hydrolase [Pyrinomonadaceae bacterium]
MKIRAFVISFLLMLIVGHPAFSQGGKIEKGSATVKRIETYLGKLEKIGFSGSVLVELNGKKAISRGYGFRNEARKLKNTPDTVFDIGSVTKQFTGAAIIKLEMEGKLSTDDKITEYFDGVPEDKAAITIHQLLRHSSGLPGVVGGDFDPISQSEFLEKLWKTPLQFENGTRFSYSNVGYSLLSMIIEKVSGETYEQYLYQHLWKPAGMEMTGYSRPKFDKGLIAVGYEGDREWGRPDEKPWDGNAPFWHLKGNGGILSTAEDLYRWDQALLSDKLLSREAKEKYYHPKLRPDEDPNPYYAYGWDMLRTDRNTLRAWHNGTNRVFYADFYRYLDEGIVIITLSNKAHPNFSDAGREISRMIFEPDYQPPIPVADNSANRAFTDEMIGIVGEKGLAAGIKAYKERKRGVDLLERTVNSKAYDLFGEKKLQGAIDLFELNVFAFPRSANAYDSLGEAYLEAGNRELAIKNYRKSLELNPENRNAEEMLERLKNK